MNRHLSHTAALLATLTCAITTQPTHAQIVTDVSGEIELRLNPYFDTHPGTGEPTVSQIELFPVGFDNTSHAIDGLDYYSARGLSEIQYEYYSANPSEAQFDIYAFADTFDRADGDGGSASINFDITVPAPVYYRFEANAIDAPLRFEVSFNNNHAYASSYDSIYDGTFPYLYIYEDGEIVYTYGWGAHVDQGILPAGTYNVSASVISATHARYGVGLNSTGTASLHIQLLGDTDLNGVVDMQDLNTVLASWNLPDSDGSNPADLNGDGFVGIDDLNHVLTAWNADIRPAAAQASAVTTPEPATLALLLITTGALTARRPRHT